MCKFSFQCLVHEILQGFGVKFRVTPAMVIALQEAAEAYLVQCWKIQTCVPYTLSMLPFSQKISSWQDRFMEKDHKSKEKTTKLGTFQDHHTLPKELY